MPQTKEASRSRRRPKDEGYAQNVIPFTIPLEDNLARIHLNKLDMFRELSKVTRHETSRHSEHLAGKKIRPATPVKSGGPFGPAKLPEKRSRSMPVLVKAVETEKPKTPPVASGLSKAFVLPSNNPCDYHNEHASRGDAVKRAIQHQENLLAVARSQSAARRASGGFADVAPEVFRWDHVPIAFDLSENQAEMFPRSIQANRQCGGGKDPRYTKPWQDYERWREAMWFQSQSMGKGRI